MSSSRYFAPFILCMVALVATLYGTLSKTDEHPNNILRHPLPSVAMANLIPPGGTITNHDLKNHKTLLHFFSSWCSSCIMDHLPLHALSYKYHLPIYGIAWHDHEDAILRWLKKHDAPYHKIGLDSKSSLALELGVQAIPESFVVNDAGEIIYHSRGPLTEEHINDIQRLLDAQ